MTQFTQIIGHQYKDENGGIHYMYPGKIIYKKQFSWVNFDEEHRSLSDIANNIDVSSSPQLLGPIKAKVYRVGSIDHPETYFAGEHGDARQYQSLHEGHEVKAYHVSTNNTLVALHHHQLFKSLQPEGSRKTLQDAIFDEEKKSKFKVDSVNAFRNVQRKMMQTVARKGYDSVIFTQPPAPAKHELVAIDKKTARISEVPEDSSSFSQSDFDDEFKEYDTPEKSDIFIRKMNEKLDLTPWESSALDEYSYQGNHGLNKVLRNNSLSREEDKESVRHIDSAMKKSILPESVVLHRSISLKTPEDFSHISVGSTIEDKGYSSTSLMPPGEDNQHHRVTMRILAPQGSYAIAMDEDVSQNPEEKEILLPRNNKVKVTHLENLTNNLGESRLHIHGKLINEDKNADFSLQSEANEREHVAPASVKEHSDIEAMIDRFGTTNDSSKAGFITPKGRMIHHEFSHGHMAGSVYGYQRKFDEEDDHSNSEDEEADDENNHRFISTTGALRYNRDDHESFVEHAKPITDSQKRIIVGEHQYGKSFSMDSHIDGKYLTFHKTIPTHGEIAQRIDAINNKYGKTNIDFSAEFAKHGYSCLMFVLPEDIAKPIKTFARCIPDNILSEDGRETDPHVTVKYGIDTEDENKITSELKDQSPVEVTFGKVSIFSSKDYDVIKVDVYGYELHKLNKLIDSKIPHVDTHSQYLPHVTIAYVKPGEGKKYEGDTFLEGRKCTLDDLIFSNKDGDETSIHFTSNFSEMSDEEANEHPVIQRAIEKYGITDDPEKAAFITPKGQMIQHDVSRHHADVAMHAIESNDYPTSVEKFCSDTGSIRYHNSGPGSGYRYESNVDMFHPATTQQITTIMQHHPKDGSFYVDASVPKDGKYELSHSDTKNRARASHVREMIEKSNEIYGKAEFLSHVTVKPLDKQYHLDNQEEEQIYDLLFAMMMNMQGEMEVQIRHYFQGISHPDQFSSNLTSILKRNHLDAAALGTLLSGNVNPFSNVTQQVANDVFLDQQVYLNGLIVAIQSGKYELNDQLQLPPALQNRIKLYTLNLRATAAQSWLKSLPPGTVIYWKLGGCKHCEICPQLASRSYTPENIPTVPASGKTPCLSRCCCWLETEWGQRCFPMPMHENDGHIGEI